MTKALGGRRLGTRNVRWSKAMIERFHDQLATTCCVVTAAAAIGVDPGSVYYKRRSDPEFRAEWEEALSCGYQLLETRLVGHALAGGAADGALPVEAGASGEPAAPPVSADYAMRLLAMRKAILTGRRDFARRPETIASKDDAIKAIMKKLAVIEAKTRGGA